MKKSRFLLSTLPALAMCLPLCAASQTFITQGPGPTFDTDVLQTFSGALQPLLVSPIDPNTLYVGAVNGGIWRSTNFGQSWTPLTDNLPSLSIASMAFDPTDSTGKTIIAGVGLTSNGTVSRHSPQGRGGSRNGIYYSTDGGNSWIQPAGNATISPIPALGQSVPSVLKQGSFILAGTYEPKVGPPSGVGGLYRSFDTGTTFTEIPVSGAPLGTEPITAIVTPPGNPNTIYVGVTSTVTPLSTALYKSTNLTDPVPTFTPIFTSANSPIIDGTQTILKVATGPNNSIAVGIVNTGVNKMLGVSLSLDGGTTWTALDLSAVNAAGGFNPFGQGVINSAVAIDPVDPTIVYAAGQGILPFDDPCAVWKLQLSGANTISTFLGSGADNTLVHPDSRSIVVDSAGRLLFTSDGGISVRSNTGPTGVWDKKIGDLACAEQGVSNYDANNNIIFNAAQDIGASIQNGSNQSQWTVVLDEADGVNAVINDTSSSTVSYLYSSAPSLQVATRSTVTNGQLVTINPLTFVGDPINTGFVQLRMVLNLINPARMAVGGVSAVFTTTDLLQSAPNGQSIPLTLHSLGAVLGATYKIAYGTIAQPEALVMSTTQNAITNTGKLYYTPDTTTTAPTLQTAYLGVSPQDVVFDNRSANRYFVVDGAKCWYATGALPGPNTSIFTDITPSLTAVSPDFQRPTGLGFISNIGVNVVIVGGTSSTGASNRLIVADSSSTGVLSAFRTFGIGLPNTMANQISYNPKSDTLLTSAFGRGDWLMYDVTSNFPTATQLQFGLANNDSLPDTSVLTDGTIVGGRELIKYGRGTLTITGAATYTGLSIVQQGRMNVNGSIIDSVAVDAGATLGGTGAVGGTAFIGSGATISPGNSIGTLSVGALSLLPGSITNIEISPTAASKIVVTGAIPPGFAGTAALNGNVQVVQDPGNYPATGAYTILTAAGITGSFDPTVLGNIFPGFNFTLLQTSTYVQLLYRRFMLLNGVSGNALTFGNFINQNAPTSKAEQLLSVLSGDTLKEALESASPLRNAIPTFIVDNMIFSFGNSISTHFSAMHYNHIYKQLGCIEQNVAVNLIPPEELLASMLERRPRGSLQQAAQESENNSENNSTWGTVFADFAHQEAQEQVPAFNFNTQGVIFGYDHFSGENGVVGVAAGYAHDEYHEHHNRGKGNINAYTLAPYGTVYISNAYVELSVAGTLNTVNNHRRISFPGYHKSVSSSFNIYQVMPHVGLGYDIQRSWVVFEPFVAVDWAVNWQEGFKEHGGAFDMKQRSRRSSMLLSEVGLNCYQNLEREGSTVVLRESVAYVNKASFHVGKVTASLVGFPSSFTVEAFKKNQSLFTLGFAALWKSNSGMFGMFSYDGEFGSGYMSNDVQVKVGKFF